MTYTNYDVKQDNIYNLGINVGFFAAFLLFASAFYFIMNFYNKLPKAIKYYHALLFVVILFFTGLAILKLRK